MNESIYYDRELMIQLKQGTGLLWLLGRSYQSNWRVLRIDGFEGSRRLPISIGRIRMLFHYEESNDSKT